MLLLSVCIVTACGKYAAPIPPEALAPEAVRSIEAKVTAGVVSINWRAPDHDQRGQELKSIDAYQVGRYELVDDTHIDLSDSAFVTIGHIADAHILARDRLRSDARKQGKPGRRVDVADQQKHFSFHDRSIKPGKSYLYRVTPINQGGVAGDISQYIKIKLQNGALDKQTAEVSILKRQSVEESLSIEEQQ